MGIKNEVVVSHTIIQCLPQLWPPPPWPSSDVLCRRPGPGEGSPEDVVLSEVDTLGMGIRGQVTRERPGAIVTGGN